MLKLEMKSNLRVNFIFFNISNYFYSLLFGVLPQHYRGFRTALGEKIFTTDNELLMVEAVNIGKKYLANINQPRTFPTKVSVGLLYEHV